MNKPDRFSSRILFYPQERRSGEAEIAGVGKLPRIWIAVAP